MPQISGSKLALQTGRFTMTEYRDNRNDDDFGNTQYFKVEKEEESAAKKVLSVVYEALMTKGYDPVNQLYGGKKPHHEGGTRRAGGGDPEELY